MTKRLFLTLHICTMHTAWLREIKGERELGIIPNSRSPYIYVCGKMRIAEDVAIPLRPKRGITANRTSSFLPINTKIIWRYPFA
ncbi:hypothetical protein [Hoylesella loescheii]|uniref:hypothetical protein n=1 Tax=Hoylesella loescheii TaxID=840 RepID=UPI0028EE2B76|nr:hypothetical protein [Hoylesella loescheii]